jgi:hypothetical protein
MCWSAAIGSSQFAFEAIDIDDPAIGYHSSERGEAVALLNHSSAGNGAIVYSSLRARSWVLTELNQRLGRPSTPRSGVLLYPSGARVALHDGDGAVHTMRGQQFDWCALVADTRPIPDASILVARLSARHVISIDISA